MLCIISTSRNRSNDFSRPGKTATKAGAMSLFRDVLIMNRMIRSLLASLRSRLIVLVLIAALPGFLVTLFIANKQRQTAFREVDIQNRSLLNLVAASQSQTVANIKTLMTTLAAANEIRTGNVEGCQRLLDTVLQSSIGYRGFAVGDADGKVWCRTENLRQVAASSGSGDPSHNPALQIYPRVSSKKEFVVGDFVIGNISGRRNLSFGYPVLDASKNLIAIINVGLDVDWMNHSIDALKLPSGYVVAILDRDGTFVVRWPFSENYVGKTEDDKPIIQQIMKEGRDGEAHTAEMNGVDDTRRLYAFMSVPGVPDNDLFVVVGISPELAYAEINDTLRQNLVTLGVFTTLALAGAWLLGGIMMLRPISALSRAAQQISNGDLSARTQVQYGQGELSVLARNFDEMALELQKRTDELTQVNAELEKRVQLRTGQLQQAFNKLRQLSSQQRQAIEDEQTRISREVHDQIGQALTGLKMELSGLQRRMTTNPSANGAKSMSTVTVVDKIKSMSDLIDEAIQTTRAIARRLRPTILDDLGLGAALEWSAQDFQERSGIECSLVNHNVSNELDRNVSTAAYRIVQEALTNVTRHAQASDVLIELEIKQAALHVCVTDNGRGIPSDRLEHSKSLGILGMRERSRELGGTVEIHSPEGKGTRVEATLPLASTEFQDTPDPQPTLVH